MPNPAVTIRHARNAIHLVISGALRDIEAEFGEDITDVEACRECVVDLFNNIEDQIDQWEICSHVYRMRELVYFFHVMLDPNTDVSTCQVSDAEREFVRHWLDMQGLLSECGSGGVPTKG